MEEWLTKFFVLLVIVIFMVLAIVTITPILLQMTFGQTATTQGLQPLPQDYYVITQPPKGIVVQQESSNILTSDGIMGLISGLLSGGAGGIYAKLRGDKNQKTVQEVAQTQVKIAEVQQGTLEQVYENMPQKGNEITNKPVIKQDNVQQIKDKAVETASKA